ncbi:L-cystine transporter [Psychrilyobacter atlanticus]|uniref:L-cystine transporter n=1 Tax=Psychrilyobacter atlanticus TaxID=271091 RepID=UPI0004056DE7|nr:cation:dicarboxylase symporter family transporter [Psychrilyobacter atlanticus]
MQILNILIMAILVYVLAWMQKSYKSFTNRVFTGLGLGILFGVSMQVFYGQGSEIISNTLQWTNIIGSGYVSLLKMIVIPLIMVSIASSVINAEESENSSIAKMSTTIIGLLLVTCGIAALISIFTSLVFNLSAEGLISGAKEAARMSYLEGKVGDVSNASSLINQIVGIIPDNPFKAMTGAGNNSTIGVVIFSALVGMATRKIKKNDKKTFELIQNGVNAAQSVVLKLVQMVLGLTPYGVLALMTKVCASSNFVEISRLGNFVVATYVALALMFGVHLLMIMLCGVSPIIFLKKAWTVLTFAFTSRTSAGSIPMNIDCQTKKLGVPNSIASMSAGIGATVGQNGCGGVYPAMLAVMIATATGINVLEPAFFVKLVIVVVIASLGGAGIGGGATIAALIVLPIMGLPIELVGLLIAIEPILDQGRTALNVSGAMATGVVTAKLLGSLDKEIYNDGEGKAVLNRG